jgi:serine/threonine-protein kinase
LLVNICTADPPMPSTVISDAPPGFDAWVRRALAREQTERFQSAYEVADSLSAVAGVESRMGATSVGSRGDVVERDLVRAESSPDAMSATGAPLATTHIPTRRSRRSLVMLGLLFAGVLLVAFVAARALLHTGPEPSTEASTSPVSSVSTVASGGRETTPEVTPVTGSAFPAQSSSAEAPQTEPSPKPVKGEGAHAHGHAVRPPPAAKPPAETAPPRPARPGDVLGY